MFRAIGQACEARTSGAAAVTAVAVACKYVYQECIWMVESRQSNHIVSTEMEGSATEFRRETIAVGRRVTIRLQSI